MRTSQQLTKLLVHAVAVVGPLFCSTLARSSAGGTGWVGSDPHGMLQYNNQGSCVAVTAYWQVTMQSDFQGFPAQWMNEADVGARSFAYLDQGYFHAPIGGGWSEKTVMPGYVVPHGSC